MAPHHLFGVPGFTLGQRFANADDGRDARGQRTLRFLGHRHIALCVVLPALGVAHDAIARAEIVQHVGADLSREGAGCMARHILSAQLHAFLALQPRLCRAKVGRRHAEGHVACGRRAQAVEHCAHQRFIGRDAPFHHIDDGLEGHGKGHRETLAILAALAFFDVRHGLLSAE